MGMSTHAMGIREDSDPEFQKHKKVARACVDAGLKSLIDRI